ncbi:MAG: terminase TerL endonuclease subunit [Burkholderiaceae bacterium]
MLERNDDYVKVALRYAKAVVGGQIPACKYVRQACQRQINDLARFKGKASVYRFNPVLIDAAGQRYRPADRVCAFVERLAHVKGPLAGQLIELQPRQCFMLTTVFGWVRADGRRRFRRSYVEVGRGNAKSSISSTLALYMLTADGEGGAEVYCLDEGTRILTEDFQWRALSEMKVGDPIWGFDENPPGWKSQRKIRRARIENLGRITLPAYRITLADGRSVVASGAHQWLIDGKPSGDGVGHGLRWARTDELAVNAMIKDLGAPWEQNDSRMAGYLAGVFDGEGSIARTVKERTDGGGGRQGFRVAFAQLPGIVLDTTRAYCELLGFYITRYGAVHPQSGVMSFAVSGLYNATRFLGSVRPHRLVHNAIKAFDGATPNRVGTARVVSIEYLGERELVTIGTSTKTLFAEGLFSHNSLATTRDQARIVFGDAQSMARADRSFRSAFGVEVNAHNINVIKTGSKFEALSAEGSTLDGLNIHFGCIDELHAHKTRTVYDVVETGTGKRDNSLLWVITTAGSNRAGICYEVRTFVTKLLNGVFEDDSQFGIIFGLDETDDWTTEEALIKANPNWGISVRPEVLLPLQAKAMQMPSAVNNFKTKHLNEWVNADTAWMDMRAWDRCADAALDIEAYTGKPCWIGLDLASKTDIAALVMVFEHTEIAGAFAVFGKYYLPEDTVNAAGNSQYPGWMNAGRLTVTPGNVIDFSWIEADLGDMVSRFSIQAVAFDPFQATQLSTRMMSEGLPMIEVRPTVLNFSEPMKTLEALVLQGKLIHDGDPVLGWMASNVVAHLDVKDNIYPRKERPENKIDGIVALIMALSRAIKPGDSVVLGSDYELMLL